ncbi:distal tail protein Dit [Inconstantimicrobium mannanitabidum]|uniref:Uncharacterized protein n=1 Tax=Inconstantimicrobium mannanitabidum TaxID=1604901 RepID=A0ACB5R9X4_9CLOT|nr:distal tail protein Dit [Clostridium sp. TW13]GKX65840.1 hypothetical protein rsdtw13_10980 [Clostridium sp. TW13]
MQDYNFYFNNKWLDSFGKVYVYEQPSDTKINEDIEYVEVDGRSGAYIKKKGTYKDRELSFKLNIIDKDFYKIVDEIEHWMTNIKDNRLVYARQDRCYIVKTVEITDAKKENNDNGTIIIKFRCEPFKTNLEEIEQSLNNK